MASLASLGPALDRLTIEIVEEIEIHSSLTATFEALLEQLGPYSEGAPGSAMPMVIEPWPGGRWFRDLGDNNGHLWGHVQAIKKPTLLEIVGPLFMSTAVASNVQYRLKEISGGTLLTMRHTALGLFSDEIRKGMVWKGLMDRVKKSAEAKKD